MSSTSLASLVGLVNKLQAIATTAGDHGGGKLPGLWESLPQIVCIGGQSAGKSSVMEAVVGRDFLPRSSGICTRRPLVLQLLTTKPGGRETASFLHTGNKLWDISESGDALRDEIEAETERTCPGKSISGQPIMLTIRSPNVPCLTLVDMPGLTKIATDNQPPSIVKELDDLSRAYIKPPHVVILAVSPANADIATSDAMRLVREVDPSGERTIGVLTKLDLMDKGTDARDVLEGRSLFLQHGWIGVVNRSQADIASRADMSAARAREAAFFEAHAGLYAGLRCGTKALVTTLASHLESAIRRAIPSIRAHVDASVSSCERALRAAGGDLPHDRGGRARLLSSLCDEVERCFEARVEGGSAGGARSGGGGGGGGGAIGGTASTTGESIRRAFDGTFPSAVRALPFKDAFSPRRVADTIASADGLQPHLLAPEAGLRALIRDGVRLLSPPSAAVVDDVASILRGAFDEALAIAANRRPELARFAALRAAMGDAAHASVEEHSRECSAFVATLVDMEGSLLSAGFFREARRAAAAAAEREAAAAAAAGAAAAATSAERDASSAANGGDGHVEKPPAEDAGGQHRGAALRRMVGLPPPSPPAAIAVSSPLSPAALGADKDLREVASTAARYVDAVTSSLLASVPKAVVHVLVRRVEGSLLSALHARIAGAGEEELARLAGEDARAAAERDRLRSRLGMLRAARAELATAG